MASTHSRCRQEKRRGQHRACCLPGKWRKEVEKDCPKKYASTCGGAFRKTFRRYRETEREARLLLVWRGAACCNLLRSSDEIMGLEQARPDQFPHRAIHSLARLRSFFQPGGRNAKDKSTEGTHAATTRVAGYEPEFEKGEYHVCFVKSDPHEDCADYDEEDDPKK
jgi:hypothetical protein